MRLNLKAILRIQKLKNYAQISGVENHNSRHSSPANADLQKKRLQLVGYSSTVSTIKALLNELQIKPRKNAVLAAEYLLTASPEAFNDTAIDIDQWAESNIEFLRKKHGRGLIAAWLHLDESTPHIHALVVPLLKKPDGSAKLCARDFFGGKQKLATLQTQYAQAMKKFGLERGIKGSTANHKRIKSFYAELNQRVDASQKTIEKALQKHPQPSILTYKKIHQEMKKMLNKMSYSFVQSDQLAIENQRLKNELVRTNNTLQTTREELFNFKETLRNHSPTFVKKILQWIDHFVSHERTQCETNAVSELSACFDAEQFRGAVVTDERWAHLALQLEELKTPKLTQHNNYKR